MDAWIHINFDPIASLLPLSKDLPLLPSGYRAERGHSGLLLWSVLPATFRDRLTLKPDTRDRGQDWSSSKGQTVRGPQGPTQGIGVRSVISWALASDCVQVTALLTV